MIAGLLFARAGVRTLVLEKHGTSCAISAATPSIPRRCDLFPEIGLLDRLLERPHDKVHDFTAYVGDDRIEVADFSHSTRAGMTSSR